jgi:hypothetical protein
MNVMKKLVLVLALLASNAFAAGRKLAEPPLGPSSYGPYQPLVAYAGGRYLTVWVESLDSAGYRILGAYSDSEGNRLSPSAFFIAGDVVALPVQLLGTGNAFALFLAFADSTQMIDIDLAGHVTGTRTIAIDSFHVDGSIGWNGTHFVAVESTRAVFFDRDGTFVRKITLTCRPLRYEMLSLESDVIVASVCATGGGLRADRIASDGTITRTMLDPEVVSYDVRITAARGSNGRMLLAWGAPASEQTLKTAILSMDGTVTSMHTIAMGGNDPYEPLIAIRTGSRFLLAYLTAGRLHVSTLASDGTQMSRDDTQVNSYGRPASAASNGTKILVSDIAFEANQPLGQVRTRRIAAGAPIATTGILSIIPARQLPPAIGAGSGALVAIWTEQQGSTSSVRAARLAPDGTPLSASLIEAKGTLASRDLAWNGAEYLTVIHRNGELRAQRIDAFGEKAGSATLLMNAAANSTPHVAVAWADDHWEVAGTDAAGAFHAEVAAGGAVSSWTALKLEGPLPEDHVRTGIYDVAIAWDGERAHVAWIEGRYFPCSFECIELRPAFVATLDRFAAQAGEPQRISDEFEFAEALSLAANEDTLVSATSRYNDVTFVTSLPLRDGGPQATRSFDGAADVTWDGSSFVLALRERDRLTVRRLDANLRDAGRARSVAVAPPDAPLSVPSVAVAIPGNAVITIHEVEANSGARAIAYAEQELGSEPQRRRTVRR